MRILLVEDHPDQAELTRRTLERQLPGAQITLATRGRACLARLAEASYDLLLLDYSLPDINGLELLREVKRRGYRLPVMMVTGQGDERIAVEAMKGGAADYLIKTGDYLMTLPAVLQKVLHQDQLQRNLAAAQAEVLQRNRELTDLHTLASTLSASLHVADLLSLALELILASLEAECGGVYLYSLEEGDLILTAHRGLSTPACENFPERVRVGEGLVGTAAQAGKAISLGDLSQGPLAESGLSWLIVAPLMAKGRLVGTLFVGSTRTDGSSPERQRLLELMGNQVGVALENAQLFETTQRRLQETEALLSVSQAVNSTLDLTEILKTVASEMGRTVSADTVVAYLAGPEGAHLCPVAGHHVPTSLIESLKEHRIPLKGHQLLEVAWEQKAPVFSGDVRSDPRVDRELIQRFPHRSQLFVPIVLREEVIGGFFLIWWEQEGRVTAKELRLLGGMSQQVALAINNARLYEEAKRAYEELQQTQQQLVQSEKFRALGEMAGGVAHDFNNLLTAVLGRAQYLLLQLEEGEVAPREARRNLVVIERAALDGAETVRRLLEFTRAAPRPGEAVAVDVNELLIQTVEVSRHRWKDDAEAKGHKIQVVVEPGEVPPVLGNPAELREVLLNLVFNAIDAMPEGGTLSLSSWAEDGMVCLAVKDTGVGIPEEVRSRIFDPFFTTKGPQSSGLGLSASYGIIHRHEGEIVVDSQEGQGTTFTIKLPVRPVPAPRVEVAPTASRRRLRILVVDDEADVRETLRDVLEAAKHEVWEAGSGSEGLEILEGQPVDVVFTDLGMPGMTGWELADRIKARWPGVKVALITGWGVRVEPEELKAHGVDVLIAKPFQMKQILRALSDLGPLEESNASEAPHKEALK